MLCNISSNGLAAPLQGISEDFDEAEAAVHKADADLDAYLVSMRKRIGVSVQYVQLHKETHVLEVPEVHDSEVNLWWKHFRYSLSLIQQQLELKTVSQYSDSMTMTCCA